MSPTDPGADVPEFLAFGDLAVDSVAMVDHFPTADEKLWVEPAGDFAGGMIGNAAVAVAQLGRTSGVVSLIGADDRGRLVLEAMRARGVDLRFVREVDAPTFWTLALTVTTGDRTLIQFPTPAFGADWERFDRSLIPRARWVHTIAEEGDPVGPLLREAHAAGVTTSLDIEYPFVLRTDLDGILPDVDVAFLNAAAAAALGGAEQASIDLQGRGAGTVLVTMGENGAMLRDRDGRVTSLPVWKVDSVDTNGAGDVFAGAFAAGILAGFSELEAAELAGFMAALSTTAFGGHGPALSQADIRERARAGGFEWWSRL
jgi:sulfofructose kinase